MKLVTQSSQEAGFTLIELTFVIVILSILIVMATLTYSSFQTKATTDLVNIDIKVIKAALQTYYMKMQRFPDNLSDLKNEGYLDELPDDKFAPGNSYKYTKGDPSKIWSVGPDGQDDGGDTNKDIPLDIYP